MLQILGAYVSFGFLWKGFLGYHGQLGKNMVNHGGMVYHDCIVEQIKSNPIKSNHLFFMALFVDMLIVY